MLMRTTDIYLCEGNLFSRCVYIQNILCLLGQLAKIEEYRYIIRLREKEKSLVVYYSIRSAPVLVKKKVLRIQPLTPTFFFS